MKKLLLLSIIGLLIGVNTISAQQLSKKELRKQEIEFEKTQPWKIQYIIGANVTVDKKLVDFIPIMGGGAISADYGLVVVPGISFEVRFSRHSGVETGLYYRYGAKGSKNGDYLSIPLLYKFNSRILNFAVGPNFDFGIAKKTSDKHFNIGALLRLTKDIKLYKGLIIEPYIQTNYMFSEQLWVGVGVGLKYRF